MASKDKVPAMKPESHAHPGLEMDARGKPIPIDKRLPEDREKVKKASRRRDR